MSADGRSERLALVGGALATALAYIGLYHLNGWLFSHAMINENVSWVFLPAAVRMLAVLLFGWAGVAGLFAGSVLVVPDYVLAEPVRCVTLGVLSSFPALVAARWVQQRLQVPLDLGGMRPRHLMWFGLAGGLANSLGHTLYFMLEKGSLDPLAGFVPMFAGDTAGTLLTIYAVAFLLRGVRLPPPAT